MSPVRSWPSAQCQSPGRFEKHLSEPGRWAAAANKTDRRIRARLSGSQQARPPTSRYACAQADSRATAHTPRAPHDVRDRRGSRLRGARPEIWSRRTGSSVRAFRLAMRRICLRWDSVRSAERPATRTRRSARVVARRSRRRRRPRRRPPEWGRPPARCAFSRGSFAWCGRRAASRCGASSYSLCSMPSCSSCSSAGSPRADPAAGPMD